MTIIVWINSVAAPSSYRRKNVTPHCDAGPVSMVGRGGGYAGNIQLPSDKQRLVFITSCSRNKVRVIQTGIRTK